MLGFQDWKRQSIYFKQLADCFTQRLSDWGSHLSSVPQLPSSDMKMPSLYLDGEWLLDRSDLTEPKKETSLSTDLLAMIEDYDGMSLDSTVVEDDLWGASRTMVGMRKKEIGKVLDRLRYAKRLRLAFLVDTTGSMQRHIDGVRQQIVKICSELRNHFTERKDSKSSISVAFVGYRDFCDGPQHFDVFPFTTDIPRFQRFVKGIVATGGGDGPEDVNGGLRQALDGLEWDSRCTNVLFHVGDAPPHGEQYSAFRSDPVSRRGMVSDEPIEQLFRRFKAKRVEYYFGKINSSTDTMVSLFSKALGEPVVAFDVMNPLDILDSVTSASTLSLLSRTDESVAPVSRTTPRELIKAAPDWSNIKKTFVHAVVLEWPRRVRAICQYGALKRQQTQAYFKIAPEPFAKGAQRYTFHAKEYVPKRTNRRSESIEKDMVCKKFQNERSDRAIHCYNVALEIQTIAAYLANKFDDALRSTRIQPHVKVEFLETRLLTLIAAGRPSYYTAERALCDDEDTWVRVINNAGMVRKPRTVDDEPVFDCLSAFAHWSYEITKGYLMVTDLQGIVTSAPGAGSAVRTVVLTDPAIHCAAFTRFGRTNLGAHGMAMFFETHECNDFCRALRLSEAPIKVQAQHVSLEDDGRD